MAATARPGSKPVTWTVPGARRRAYRVMPSTTKPCLGDRYRAILSSFLPFATCQRNRHHAHAARSRLPLQTRSPDNPAHPKMKAERSRPTPLCSGFQVLFFHFPFHFFLLFFSFMFSPLSVTRVPSGLLFPVRACFFFTLRRVTGQFPHHETLMARDGFPRLRCYTLSCVLAFFSQPISCNHHVDVIIQLTMLLSVNIMIS
ncbi:hypothetical protein F5148DRAFT_477546 [Russula earlei]|uniref:Uncharacterized protein n=1 Tax=Russula earlei TaxID=71964 RepID=A0ACC0TZQ5_9AGAM|nr:hypothetical protein F5148DRAFT_477546 [Russula earlei]